MSIIRKEGKDTIIFATKEDHATPSKLSLPEPEPQAGLIFPDGSINWNCPCLGGMATGPCGIEFREAFTCFHFSKEDPKGSDCFDSFKTMQTCMAQYPSLYNKNDVDLDDMENDEKKGQEKDIADNHVNELQDNPNIEKNVEKAQ